MHKTLRKLRNKHGYTLEQLCLKIEEASNGEIKPSKGNVSKWETGQSIPSLYTAKVIADIYNVTVEELIEGIKPEPEYIKVYSKLSEKNKIKAVKYMKSLVDETTQDKPEYIDNYTQLNLYGYASAGTGQQVFDEPVREVIVPTNEIPTGDYDIMLQVVGDSMKPAFEDGEYIFIKKTHEFKNGQFGVFIINGESYLKKVYQEKTALRLVSLNPDYNDLYFNENDNIKPIGRVVL